MVLNLGKFTGNQPNGRMSSSESELRLPGYPRCGSIIISYTFFNGIQGPSHPNPGKPYNGTNQKAYLPNNEEGRKVLKLLKIAFDRKLTFTIGKSQTTRIENCVIWNNISHKTSREGGPTK